MIGEKKVTVLVTGASGGIGRAIAEAFLAAGHRVALHYNRNEAAVVRAVEEARGRRLSALAVRADLRKEDEIFAMIGQVRHAFGPVDVLINNAGVALPQKLLTDCTAAEWDDVFNVNVRGMFLVTKAALPHMIAKKRGSIVNISSMWGVTGGSCEAAYSASKAAVIGLTKAIAKEVAPSGVRVNCIAPGFIDTSMNAGLSRDDVEAIRLETPLETLGTPEDVANAALFLALGGARFITGQVLCVDGGRCI